MKKGLLLVPMVLLAYFLGIAMADEVDGLIKQLTSNNPQKRLAAAKALGEKKDPRAVNPLVAALKKDVSWDVRVASEGALISIGGPSVEPLVKLLKEDKDCFVRRRATRALKDIKDTCDPKALKNAAQNEVDCCVRRFAAKALSEIKDPSVTEFLDDAMKKKNTEIISAAYTYYIKKGEPGTEDILIEALQESSYDRKMVFDFSLCGNEKLKQAADDVIKKRKFKISSDWSGPKWGVG
jgi:HEAT repeat protein